MNVLFKKVLGLVEGVIDGEVFEPPKEKKVIDNTSVLKVINEQLLEDDTISEFDGRLAWYIARQWSYSIEYITEKGDDGSSIVSGFIREYIVLKYLIRKDLAKQFVGLVEYDDIQDLVDAIILDHKLLLSRYFERQIIQLNLMPFFRSLPLTSMSYRTSEFTEDEDVESAMSYDLSQAANWLTEYEHEFEIEHGAEVNEREALNQEELEPEALESTQEFDLASVLDRMLDTVFDDDEIKEYSNYLNLHILKDFSLTQTVVSKDYPHMKGSEYARFIRLCIVLKYLIRKDLVAGLYGLSTQDDIYDVVDVIALSHLELIQNYFTRKSLEMGFKEFFDSFFLRYEAYELDEHAEPDAVTGQIKDDIFEVSTWFMGYACVDDFEEYYEDEDE